MSLLVIYFKSNCTVAHSLIHTGNTIKLNRQDLV